MYVLYMNYLPFLSPTSQVFMVHGTSAQGIEEAKELCANGSCTSPGLVGGFKMFRTSWS